MNEAHVSEPPVLCDCGDPECPGRVPVRYPFGIAVDAVSDDLADAELYLTVRTSSWEYNGERTDLHDLFSLLWAASIRAREAASVRLVTVLNGFSGIDSEIYARLLLLDQPGPQLQTRSLRARAEAASAESLAIFELLAVAFGHSDEVSHSTDKVRWAPEPNWVSAVRRRLRLAEHKDYEIRLRPNPKWAYFGCNKRGITVAEIDASAAEILRAGFGGFKPVSAAGIDTQLYRTGDLVNAPTLKALDQLGWLLRQVDGEAFQPVIIPIDSHVIGIGKRSVAAVRVFGGRDSFDTARDQLAERRADEAVLLNDDSVCRWAEKIDDGRFERFVEDLVTVERGVHRVRQVGATREADDGRDLMAEWSTPPDRGGNAWRDESGMNLSTAREVLVQIKLRHGGVGRSDLPGLRDTLEHYGCGGLLLVAFPRVTVTLMNHLAELRRRGQWWVDWWGKTELEARVRRHPEVAARYPDVVVLEPPRSAAN